MFNFEKKVLDNGLRVLLVPMKNSEAATIQVLVGVGSKNETKEINGISHFLEHMFFKGTQKRPKPWHICREFDKLGALNNAFTAHELTYYWVKSSAKDFNEVLNIVSDILLNSIFKKEEIEKERNVILQEIDMYEDLPQRKVIDDLFSLMYKNQPVGRLISGTKETIRDIKREDILKYMKSQYVSNNLLIVVAGGIDKERSLKKIEEAFRKVKKSKSLARKKTKILQKRPEVRITNKQTDQTHLIIGFHTFDMYDEKRYALSVLSKILGEKRSSRLFVEIREKLGLAYYVGSFIDLQSDLGVLAVRAGISHNNLEKTIKKILEIFSKLKKVKISKKELDEAKSHIRGQMALSFETTDQVADFYGEQELFYKKIMQPDEILKKVEKVSQDDILKVARDIFRPEKINMAVIGSHKETQKIEDYYKNLFSKI